MIFFITKTSCRNTIRIPVTKGADNNDKGNFNKTVYVGPVIICFSGRFFFFCSTIAPSGICPWQHAIFTTMEIIFKINLILYGCIGHGRMQWELIAVGVSFK